MENSENEEPKTELIELEKPQKTPKSFWSFFSHPAWIPISILIGIFSSYYFFEVAKVSPQLVFYVSPVKATIVKAGQASDIKTFYRDIEINTDVTVAQIAIWNQGNASIKKEQVLKPIVLFTENSAPILEATIKKSTREVTQLDLNQDENQKGRLMVSWNILEQNDGGVIQIIYAGDSQTNIHIEGIIEGQKEVIRSIPSERIKSPEQQYAEIKGGRAVWFPYVAIPVFFLFGLITIRTFGRNIKKATFSKDGKTNYNELIFLIFALLFMLLLITGAIYIFYSALQYEKLSVPFNLN